MLEREGVRADGGSPREGTHVTLTSARSQPIPGVGSGLAAVVAHLAGPISIHRT